ncbi:hypothetical protein EIN_299230 [Entamoeba invadens IP1]|uniref:Uncharacterized protein n=1 Tax=Entamoeba invadens IP1 TaxID=370355 RepID=L7FKU7_ENTIV|nr:hypothetical protein EIN_299230 [Entamoeba invadens IP1]ELP87066.1 hypothetical protein EIN_299230 [Entamoeba invadens IP1]|eukprot:XP_004253837.1 hypothetical protein EIN_299230 [Entamoeba invadens IP1]
MVGFFIIGYNYINLNVRDLKKKEEELNNEIGVEMENEGVNEIHPENISFEEKRGSRESVEQIEENNKSELKEDIHIDIEKIKDITKTIDKKEEVPNPLLEYQVKPIHYEEEDEGIDDDDILVDDEISSDELEEEQENETTTQNVSQNGSIKMDEVRDKTPSIPSRDISVNSPEIIKSKEDVTSQEKATKTRKINSFSKTFKKVKRGIKKFFKTILRPFVFCWKKLPSIVRFSIKNFFSVPTMATIFGIIFMLLKWIRDPLLVSGGLEYNRGGVSTI